MDLDFDWTLMRSTLVSYDLIWFNRNGHGSSLKVMFDLVQQKMVTGIIQEI